MGEQLLCEREPGNVVDRYAMAVKRIRASPLAVFLGRVKMCSTFTQRALDTKISRDQQITAFTKTMRILILRIVPNAILKSSRKKPAIRYINLILRFNPGTLVIKLFKSSIYYARILTVTLQASLSL